MAKLCRIFLTAITFAIAVGIFIPLAGPAIAAELEMICQNPRRSYLVVFDDKAKTFKLKTPGEVKSYLVEGVDRQEGVPVVRGKTVKGGPDFAAYLGTKKRIDFLDGEQVIQTDLCK